MLPWLYLSFKRARRLKAFKYSLADTLQLMSSSLSAGLSLAQSVDTVVREGNDPIAGEFRRALSKHVWASRSKTPSNPSQSGCRAKTSSG